MSSQELATTNSNNQLVALVIPDDFKVYGEITISDIKQSSIGIQNKEILLAHYTNKPIKDLEANYAGEQLKTFINLTIFESGYKTENISELIIMVIKDIFTDFGNMTLAEVAYAYRRGIRKDFGEFMGMSVITFYGWLKQYNTTVKIEAMKALQLIRKEISNEISEETKKAFHRNWIKSHLEDFERRKKGKPLEVYDFANIFYDYCQKHGIGYLSKEEKKELFEKGKEVVLTDHSHDKARTVYEARGFREVVNAIVGSEIPKTVKEKIASEAKRLAVAKIYDKLIEQNINLGDLINVIENIDQSPKSPIP